MIAFSGIFAFTPIPANTIYVQSPTSLVGSKDATFDVFVSVNQVTNLFGAGFTLNFPQAYINVVSTAPEAFLGTDVVFFPQIENSIGKVSIGISKKAGQSSVTGSGNLAKITFKILNTAANQVVLPFTLSSLVANNQTGQSITLTPQESSTTLTVPVQQFTIATSSNPSAGGTTSGNGSFFNGQVDTVKAVPNNGYAFVNWTEGQAVVSTSPNYSFTVNSNRTLTANFNRIKYTITLSSNPVSAGTTSGGGIFNSGDTVTITASPNNGFMFLNWTEGTTVISTNISLKFAADANRSLIANFVASKFTITLSSNPPAGGTTSGGGIFNFGDTVKVIAVASNEYVFTNWTVGNTIISADDIYSFTASENKNLTANFISIVGLPVLTISKSFAAVGDSVTVSVTTKALVNLSALTLKIQYDTTKLSFGRTLNLDSQVADALVGVKNGIITVAWDNMTGVNLSDNKLFDIKFFFIGSTLPTPVTFQKSLCELADPSGNNIFSVYVNGSVTPGLAIKGKVVYSNTAASPISNATVYLSSSAVLLDSTLTNSAGEYSFNGVGNGNYKLISKSTKPWGGVSSTDALLVRQFIAGIRTFDPLQFQAADVNVTNSVTSVDALLIRKRIANPDSTYKAGDWISENPSVVVSGSSITQNIKMCCTADVNSSFVPPLLKSNSSIDFEQKGNTKLITSELLDLPVTVNQQLELGAITLFFNYPKDQFDVINISSKCSGLVYSATNGVIRIAWDDLVPVTFLNGETLITLKLKLKNSVNSVKPPDISCLPGSEFADSKGNIIGKLTLNFPSINVTLKTGSFLLEQNFPNPFNPVTNIYYQVPLNTFVTLKVFNALGKEVKILVNEKKEAGKYNVEFNGINLPSGVYFYQFRAGQFTDSKKLILLK